jgi:hypothetical protein
MFVFSLRLLGGADSTTETSDKAVFLPAEIQTCHLPSYRLKHLFVGSE